MFDTYNEFQKLFDKQEIKLENDHMNVIFQRITLIFIQKEEDIKINKKDDYYHSIFIKKADQNYDFSDYFFILFENALYIVQFHLMKTFLSFLKDWKLYLYCFSQKTQEYVQQEMTGEKEYINISDNYIFQQEIDSFILKFKICFKNVKYKKRDQIIKFWNQISKIIAVFLIKKGYSNTDDENFFDGFYKANKDEMINPNDLIQLRPIGQGCSSIAYLVYNIKKEKIMVLKLIYNKAEDKKLFNRERENLLNIRHPLLPRYYGHTKIESFNCLLIEYFEGKSLKEIDPKKITDNQKIKIIMTIMVIIEYLHCKGFIYRELKPEAFIVHSNFTPFLIDFDRMVKNDSNEELTRDFGNKYVADEVYSGHYSKKADIYSLGMIINYLFSDNFPNKFIKLKEICKSCTQKNPNNRPKISYLIDFFFETYYVKTINIDSNFIVSKKENIHTEIFFPYWFCICIYPSRAIILFSLKYMLSEGQNTSKNGILLIDIANNIDFLTHASNYNYSKAQFRLGELYLEGQTVHKDVDKAIKYFTLAAKQNNVSALFQLGLMYYKGSDVLKDLNKSIYYFTLAAEHNKVEAQYNLGVYYLYECKPVDIKKAVYYLKLAANQQFIKACINLGLIYSSGQYKEVDIKQAIFYYSIAANQNDSTALRSLGEIYYHGTYVRKDIDKAISYFSRSAKFDSLSMYWLGYILVNEMNNKYIESGIHYLKIAARENCSYAQYLLGQYYLKGQHVKQNIKKALNYFWNGAQNNNDDCQLKIGLLLIKGEYFQKNVNKGIEFIKLSAKQNNIQAIMILGQIYNENCYVPKDYAFAFHCYSLAAKQDHDLAYTCLGSYYYLGKHVKKDINKALELFSIAANKKESRAMCLMGIIYYYDMKKYNKGIEYLIASANLNNIDAQYELGDIYLFGENVSKNMSKAILYFTLAANNNHKIAQYKLGLLYFYGIGINKNIIKGISLFDQSSKNGFFESDFKLGFLYQQGKYIKQDIEKSIKYYKNASSFNHSYAKNNLGVIYKMGFDNKVTPRIYSAIEYFNEAIEKTGNILSIYNLIHTYLFEIPNYENYIKSLNLIFTNKAKTIQIQDFQDLICLILVSLFGFDFNKIIKGFRPFICKYFSSDLISPIFLCDKILRQNLIDKKKFDALYQKYKSKVYIYDEIFNPILFTDKAPCIKMPKKPLQMINSLFYEGLGDIIDK